MTRSDPGCSEWPVASPRVPAPPRFDGDRSSEKQQNWRRRQCMTAAWDDRDIILHEELGRLPNGLTAWQLCFATSRGLLTSRPHGNSDGRPARSAAGWRGAESDYATAFFGGDLAPAVVPLGASLAQDISAGITYSDDRGKRPGVRRRPRA